MSDDNVSDLQERLVAIRRAMHRHPEVGLQLPWTQQLVNDELSDLPLEITRGLEISSIVAVLRGGAARGANAPAVLLRADMDALPLEELVDSDYRSEVAGAMHACGHDLHTAMLIGAARVLSERRDELAGDVVFMFQPGEEGYDGADIMVRDGVLDAAGPRVRAAYALHVFSGGFARGSFFAKGGPTMASADGFRALVRGAGGHGSAPHLAKDPVTAAAEMIVSLQVALTRRVSALDPAVVSVGMVRAGTQQNIIPETAEFEATVRCFSEETRRLVEDEIRRVCEGIASANGVEVEIDYQRLYPATVNDDSEAAFALETATALFGPERAQPLPNSMTASEDFSRVLDEVPGAFILLGANQGEGDPADSPYNHSAYADFDDSVLSDGANLLAELAMRRLSREN